MRQYCILINMTKNQRLNIYIDPTVVRSLKAQAMIENKPMNQLAEEILRKNLPEVIVIKSKNDKDLEVVITEDK